MAKPGRKSRKVSNRHHCPQHCCHRYKTEEVVQSAIKKLTKNTGWTARTLANFIKMEYAVNDPHFSRKVSRALKRGVESGWLLTDRGGLYQLNDMSSALSRSSSCKIHDGHRKDHDDQAVRIRSQSTVEEEEESTSVKDE